MASFMKDRESTGVEGKALGHDHSVQLAVKNAPYLGGCEGIPIQLRDDLVWLLELQTQDFLDDQIGLDGQKSEGRINSSWRKLLAAQPEWL